MCKVGVVIFTAFIGTFVGSGGDCDTCAVIVVGGVLLPSSSSLLPGNEYSCVSNVLNNSSTKLCVSVKKRNRDL